jgi:hypothetical protein
MRAVGRVGLGFLLTLFGQQARAQEPARPTRAAALEAEAQAHFQAGLVGDRQSFARCGRAYVELYNEFEDHERADQLLVAAGECFVAAGQPGAAMQVHRVLLDRYPNSSFAPDTRLNLAESYAAVAYYEHAATYYEQFVGAHGNDGRASEALENAYLLRVGLDQRDAAMRDLGEYERLYARKDPGKTAAMFWSGRDLLDSSKAQREHALDYLKKYGDHGGLDRKLVAESIIAQIDWRQSCSRALLHDSCITIEREAERPRVRPPAVLERAGEANGKARRYRPPKRCGSPTDPVFTAHQRDAELAAAALRRFTAIVKQASKATSIPGHDRRRIDDLEHARAMASVYLADAEFEELLGLGLPANPLFADDETRQREMLDFVGTFEDKRRRTDRLAKRYAAVGRSNHHWELVAAARRALVYQSYAGQLHRAKLPPGLRGEAQVRRYCDGYATLARELDKQADAAWQGCLARSIEVQHFNEASRLCEREASWAAPELYPPLVELFGQPVYARSEVVSVGVLSEQESKRLTGE